MYIPASAGVSPPLQVSLLHCYLPLPQGRLAVPTKGEEKVSPGGLPPTGHIQQGFPGILCVPVLGIVRGPCLLVAPTLRFQVWLRSKAMCKEEGNGQSALEEGIV